MGKLSLWVGVDYKALVDPGGYFNAHYDPKWLDDDFVKEMIWDIDNSITNGAYSIISPKLGNISPFMLSTGCKVCILLYKLPKEQILIDMANLGQNCMYFVAEILKKKDLRLCTTTTLTTFASLPVSGVCENDGEEFNNWMEFAGKVRKFIFDYPERNVPKFRSDEERKANGYYTKEELKEMFG